MQARLDSELIAMGWNGDRQALSELFERYYASSIRIARRILPSEEDARDAVQSAYLAAFRHFGSFRGDAQFNTWMTRIVKNHCFMHLRRPERRIVCSSLEDKEMFAAEVALANRTPTPEDLARQRQVDTALSDAAGKLPKSLQDVFTLCCIAGICVREAAETLGLTVPATKARLFRAQHRVQSELRRTLVARPHYKTPSVGISHSSAIAPAQLAA
jgi:RNA polymerase sigma-70 factor, ECF subfamily